MVFNYLDYVQDAVLIVLMRQLAYCLPLIPPLFLEYVIVLYSFIRCSAGGFRQ